jgi:hypothetical protein
VIVLGLAANTHFHKAALTGRVRMTSIPGFMKALGLGETRASEHKCPRPSHTGQTLTDTSLDDDAQANQGQGVQ